MQSEHDLPGRSEEDRIEIERANRAWQRQIDAEDADRTRGSRTLRWVLVAIAAGCAAILLIERLQ